VIVYNEYVTWKVNFYKDETGNYPVEDFLRSLTPRQLGKVLQVLQLLEDFGVNLAFPYSSQIEGRLRELRSQHGKEKYRILYYADSNRVFKLLHGFRKNTDKVSEKDKQVGLQRMAHDMRKADKG
jgi:phage-related protein